jgi:hypothetical protein
MTPAAVADLARLAQRPILRARRPVYLPSTTSSSYTRSRWPRSSSTERSLSLVLKVYPSVLVTVLDRPEVIEQAVEVIAARGLADDV